MSNKICNINFPGKIIESRKLNTMYFKKIAILNWQLTPICLKCSNYVSFSFPFPIRLRSSRSNPNPKHDFPLTNNPRYDAGGKSNLGWGLRKIIWCKTPKIFRIRVSVVVLVCSTWFCRENISSYFYFNILAERIRKRELI